MLYVIAKAEARVKAFPRTVRGKYQWVHEYQRKYMEVSPSWMYQGSDGHRELLDDYFEQEIETPTSNRLEAFAYLAEQRERAKIPSSVMKRALEQFDSEMKRRLAPAPPVPTEPEPEPKIPHVVVVPRPHFVLPKEDVPPPPEKGVEHITLVAYKTKREREAFMLGKMKEFNQQYFGGMLKNITVSLKPEVSGFKVHTLGTYYNHTGHINIAPRFFVNDNNWLGLRETLLHELCHKAAEELDGARKRGDKPHGVIWSNWMIKCRLRPRATMQHKADFRTSEEKVRFEQKHSTENEAKYLQAGLKFKPYDFEPQKLGKINHNGRWIVGILVRRMTTGRWMLAISKTNYWKVGVDSLYHLTEEEKAKVDNQEMLSYFDNLNAYLARKEIMRRGLRRTGGTRLWR